MKYFLTMSLCCSIIAVSAQQKLDVQGHRGGRALMPENTIPAMLHAIDLGVKTLELDCVISKDNQVVVSHDTYMSADFMLKPDGSTISKAEEKGLLIYTMPYDSVKRYDAGTKPHPQFPDQKKLKTYKPLLSELIDNVERYVKIHHLKPVYYNLEIKSSLAGDGVAHPAINEFTKLVMDVLNKKKVTKRVTIQSFDVRPLQLLHQTNPKQVLSYLTGAKETFENAIKKLGFNPDIISPNYTTIDKDFVEQAHRAKVQVLPWTVNDEASMKKMAELKVDGIISDYPDKLVTLFGSYQK
ncbi:glycerophosphodiester phosphodiesterase family protein [Mucilaginibacter aquariorum]|uniref:Glycerophosphodiester phosphodiesterase n=1 Tax=Mucilaginibacter aquariorum TaxID=2967225 RepID=A0ABT1T239_9SPHI|nr:glycerophosphodiester phosphodiesterase family protein [Mucilaginibacter aquariorum]MCQ6958659.1 glycerophosphodiester phosphodiesterase [Mucilaginibacter aquariorum]